MAPETAVDAGPLPTAPASLRRVPVDEADYVAWCAELVRFTTGIRERFTPFPRYFELQCFNFLTMRRLLPELFPLGVRYDVILEIGCGVGAHSLMLSAFAHRLKGVDIPGEYSGFTAPGFGSSAEVSRAFVNGVFGVDHAEFADAFPDALGLADNSVDLVFSWTVLEHIPDLDRAFAEMHRVIKPGGLMVHIVPNTMSAIHTMAGDNVTASKRPPVVHPPLGYWGAAKAVFRHYLDLARGYQEPRVGGMVIPPCHSEFLTDYADQLNLYISWNYLIPLLKRGMILERLTPVNDFNYALVLRKA